MKSIEYDSLQCEFESESECDFHIRDAVKYNERNGYRIKVLTLKQMFQRLPTANAQAKAGNTSQKLLNEIKQILYFLYR